MAIYQLFTDATADLNESLLQGIPSVEIIPMEVEVDETTYQIGPGGNLTVADFYALQREGKFATTSQINPQIYHDFFGPILKQGKDILYLCFTSGMSGTYQAAMIAVRELQEDYPERKIICVDTLCASAGEGFMVREAARKQAEGMGIDELAQWVTEHRLEVCHWFTVDTFDHLRHGGRVSAAAATMGTILQIKPLLHVDEKGGLQVVEKPRGSKRAMKTLLTHMEQGWMPETGKLVVIAHGDYPEGSEQLRKMIAERFPEAEIRTTDIGPVIGAHTGPGMLAVIYWGNNR